jgi:hypothetical protein
MRCGKALPLRNPVERSATDSFWRSDKGGWINGRLAATFPGNQRYEVRAFQTARRARVEAESRPNILTLGR